MSKLIGLSPIVEEINLNVTAEEVFPHTLFIGPRGSGKTTLSDYIVKLTKGSKRTISLNAPSVTFQKLQSHLLTVGKRGIIFIDEIHRLHPKVEELLYHPMESGEYYLSGYKYPLPKFTLLAATTRPDLLTKPLMSRFKLTIRVPIYSIRNLAQIIRSDIPEFTRRECIEIARCVSVPREALNLAQRLFKLQKGVEGGLKFLGYENGLSKYERLYLEHIKHEVRSLTSLSAKLLIPEPSVEEVEERLIQLGLIDIGGKGRIITPRGLMRLGGFRG